MEYFAGRGRITTCMKRALLKSARLDLLDNREPPLEHRSNYMDLTHGSGYASLARDLRPFHL